MNKVFVYGTLIQGAVLTHRLPGYMMFRVRGQHFDFPYIQPYPWDDSLPSVYGTIIDVTDEQLVEMDKYEGVERFLYRRVNTLAYPINEIADGTPVQVYVGGPALVNEPIPSGVWTTR